MPLDFRLSSYLFRYLLVAFAAMATASTAVAQEPATDPNVRTFYQFETGDVFVEIISPFVPAFTLDSNGGLFDVSNVNSDSDLGAPVMVAGDFGPEEISFVSSDAGFLPTGNHFIGNVLDPGLTFELDLSPDGEQSRSAAFVEDGTQQGFLLVNFSEGLDPPRPSFFRGFISVSAVPEPSSAAVLLMGSAGLMLRRRRG